MELLGATFRLLVVLHMLHKLKFSRSFSFTSFLANLSLTWKSMLHDVYFIARRIVFPKYGRTTCSWYCWFYFRCVNVKLLILSCCCCSVAFLPFSLNSKFIIELACFMKFGPVNQDNITFGLSNNIPRDKRSAIFKPVEI